MSDQPQCIAIGSCQLPTSIVDRDFGLHNWHRLREAEIGKKVDALLLLGDQVYSDPSAGLWDSRFLWEAYGEPYGRLLRFIDNTGLSLRVFSVPDDHEIIEGWEPVCEDSTEVNFTERRNRFTLGIENYLDARLHSHSKQERQHLSEGVLSSKTTNYNQRANRHLHHDHLAAGMPLFMCNTRMERDHRHAGNWRRANIMGEIQFNALCDWLTDQPEDGIKLVASPAALLPRYLPGTLSQPQQTNQYPFTAGTLRSDSWDGFPNTLLRLLAFIVDRNIRNIVFLSGDLHFASVTQAVISSAGREVVITSAHCSALYAPYALANARPEQFLLDDEFSFSGDDFSPTQGKNRSYQLRSTTTPVRSGDGFCFLSNNRGHLELTVSRHGARQEGLECYSFDPASYPSVTHQTKQL